jgi:hypothetical protein
MLKVFRVALYVVGGFFVYMVNLLSFVSLAPPNKLGVVAKLGVMALFGVIGLLPILAAMATSHFREWQVPLGATLLSGVGVTVFMILTFLCMTLSPELLKSFPDFPQNAFSDYLVGGITTASLLVAGIALVRPRPKLQTDAERQVRV